MNKLFLSVSLLVSISLLSAGAKGMQKTPEKTVVLPLTAQNLALLQQATHQNTHNAEDDNSSESSDRTQPDHLAGLVNALPGVNQPKA